MSQWRKHHKDVISQTSAASKSAAAHRKQAKETKKARTSDARAAARSKQDQSQIETRMEDEVHDIKATKKQKKKYHKGINSAR